MTVLSKVESDGLSRYINPHPHPNIVLLTRKKEALCENPLVRIFIQIPFGDLSTLPMIQTKQ